MNAGSAFELRSSAAEQTVCPAETALYVVSVTNTEDSTDRYTVSLSGPASKWAVAAPSGFSLNSGATKQIFIYVTPSVSALEGTYSLKISVSSGLADSMDQQVTVDVVSCHRASLTAETTHKEVCSATLAEYDLTLKNAGKYSESFALSASGNAAGWATLSDNLVGLEAGEEKKIKVFATPPADQTGDFVLTVLARSLSSGALASQTLTLKSNSCYSYDMMLDKNYISFCENSEARIPLVVRNSGTADNVYNLKVEGPGWAKVETEKLAISAESSRETFLVLFPGFGVKGDYKATVTAEPDMGDVILKQDLTAHVESCHTADVTIADSKDTLCPFTSKLYEVSVMNSGKYAKTYALKVFGADWTELDRNFVDLDAGETAKVNLKVEPGGAPAGRYILKVTAESQDVSKTTDSDTIDIHVALPESCFGINLLPALTRVEVVPGEGSLVPVIVENKGSEESTYILDVSGTGASYAQFNPATITLGGGEAETVYMYIAVPERTPQMQYRLTISARLEDGTVSSSSTIDMVVLPAEAGVTVEEKVSTLKSSILSVANKIKTPFVVAVNKMKAGAITLKNKIAAVELPEVSLPRISLPEIKLPEVKLPGREEAEAEEKVQAAEEEQEKETETGVEQYLSEGARSLLERKEAESGGELKNATAIATLSAAGLKDKVTGFTSGVSEKLSGVGDKFSGIADKVTSIELGGLGDKFSTILGKGKVFMLSTTYYVPNWIWLVALVFILAAISYMLRKEGGGADQTQVAETTEPSEPEMPAEKKEESGKGLWQRFVDFLEEGDEDTPEAKAKAEPRAEGKPTGQREMSAEEILREADKVMRPPAAKKPSARTMKPATKKKVRKGVKPALKRKAKKGRRGKVLISEDKLIKEEGEE